MKWLGKKLKGIVEKRYGTQDEFCTKINVSRQAYSSWINDNKIPSGKSLMQIAKELQLSVSDLFEDDFSTSPQFMLMHNAKNSKEMEEAAKSIAEEYRNIIKTENAPVFEQVCNLPTNDYMRLASEFRCLAEVPENEPMGYGAVFKLATKLNICIIFRKFPDILKDTYAFHYPINNISVIFVDTNAYVTDIVFILLHEICHSVRRNNNSSEEEDDFCDKVADAAQFPQFFLNEMQHELNASSSAEDQMKILYQKTTKFSLLGLYKSFERRRIPVKWLFAKTKKDIKEINSSLLGKMPRMKDALFPNKATPEKVCENYQLFSYFFFMNFLLPQLDNMTVRFIAQIFDLPCGCDGQEILNVLRKMREHI